MTKLSPSDRISQPLTPIAMHDLEYHSVDHLPAGRAPRVLVVLCHGYGAPETDLVPIAGELLRARPALADQVRFVFPAAPLRLDHLGLYGGRAWWHLDVEQFMLALVSGRLHDIAQATPDGLQDASRRLRSLVERLRDDAGLSDGQVVLGGFSQGAMVSIDVALRLPQPPGALIVMSGTLICRDEWTRLAAARGTMRVLQSHGTQDPILPYPAAEWLHQMFVHAGLQTDWIPFAGPHTIPQEMLIRLADLLDQRIAEPEA